MGNLVLLVFVGREGVGKGAFVVMGFVGCDEVIVVLDGGVIVLLDVVEKGRLKRDLDSFILDSMSLARPMAWEMLVGFCIAISFLISGKRPDIKQFKRASAGKPKTRLPNFSKLAW